MKRRRWIFLSSYALVGACSKKETAVVERSWTDLKGKWEWVSGGQVDEEDALRIGWGEALTAVKWAGEIPEAPFEMELEAKRVNGTDFFCAVTFPARDVDECVTLVVGGWGGGLVGISSIDGKDASENETRSVQRFEEDVWYRIRLLREGERIAAWIGDEKVVDVDTTGKELSLRDGPITDCAPFGLATWQTTSLVRGARWRSVSVE